MRILQQGIQDESVIVRVYAAKGLRQTGDAHGTTVLNEILEGNNADGIAAALVALYDLEDQTFSPIVAKLTEHSVPLIRVEAHRLIGIKDDEKAREILIKGTENRIAKIRRISYLGLAKFQKRGLIHKGLQDIDPAVRITAASVLARLGEKRMGNFIKNELKAAKPQVWNYGIVALAETADTSAISFAQELLHDAPWEFRIAAAEALLTLNNYDGVDVLKQGLRSDDPFLRIRVVEIFKKYQVPNVFESLKEATRDEYINVSIGAIEALTRYHGKRSRKLFAELMDEPHSLVKITAATAYLVNL